MFVFIWVLEVEETKLKFSKDDGSQSEHSGQVRPVPVAPPKRELFASRVLSAPVSSLKHLSDHLGIQKALNKPTVVWEGEEAPRRRVACN